MRKFSSYGQIDTEMHYYAPRTALIDRAYAQLVGENPEEGGHYMTVWAPRQTGKSSVMLEVVKKLQNRGDFTVAMINMQSAKEEHTDEGVLDKFVLHLREWFHQDLPDILTWQELPRLFTPPFFTKPVILIIDGFDALEEEFINKFTNEFRSIYTSRKNETNTLSHDKSCLLHGLALVGTRNFYGVGNGVDIPFNVQRSFHIPNLSFEEVKEMFRWYEQESGQAIEPDVIERLFYETHGQPGLTCWLGELLTETYNETPERAITMEEFTYVITSATTQELPNNTILNITSINKVKQSPYHEIVIELFSSNELQTFHYDNPGVRFLYSHGVIDIERAPHNSYIKFSSPFVQKRLFHYFSDELFREMEPLMESFISLDDAITEDFLSLPHLIGRYQEYLNNTHEWLVKNAPRRADLRIREAVYHFSLYMYLHKLLYRKGAKVWPEFPTGNGQLDILMTYQKQLYGIEVKTFSDLNEYEKALGQAARYAQELDLQDITLVFFIETIAEEHRTMYEAEYVGDTTGVTVKPVFVETGK